MENTLLPALSSVRFDTYKSFNQNGPSRIDLCQNMTLIIGKNNSGKSSIIDVIQGLTKASYKDLPDTMSGICPTVILDELHIAEGFSRTYSSNISQATDFNFAYQFLNKGFTIQLENNRYIPSQNQEDNRVYLSWDGKKQTIIQNWYKVAESYKGLFSKLRIRRINAERDIVPEIEDETEIVDEYGNGTTNLIRKYINTDDYNEALVEKTILEELNKIMEPDAHFDAIRVQQVRENKDDHYLWEVFLEEDGHRYALSKSGSGLKSIMLFLVNLFIIPQLDEYKHTEIIYCFEELENNLHPALQRRVFDYLYKYSIEKNAKIIITSHSHVAINALYGKEKTQFYHVTKQDGHSNIKCISHIQHTDEIIEDLGVKASDLFQTNGIIWVEGPSDRIYILRWLKVLANCQYVEGRDFQFLYYGGRLLSHYTAEEKEKKTAGLINILTTNRHAAIVMDSDKKSKQATINETKKRIKQEFEKQGLFCWITKGKEIENYLSFKAINDTYDSNLTQITQYDLFPEYINSIDKYFSNRKVDFARDVSKSITADNSSNILDLKQQINELYKEIKQWNS